MVGKQVSHIIISKITEKLIGIREKTDSFNLGALPVSFINEIGV